MRLQTAQRTQWLRYTTAVLALFWAVGLAAGCHLPHAATSAAGLTSQPAAATGQDLATRAHLAPAGADSCSPLDQVCKHVAQACSTSDLVALDIVVTVIALAGSLAGPVIRAPRAPPRTAGFAFRRGRNLLTRFCIARI